MPCPCLRRDLGASDTMFERTILAAALTCAAAGLAAQTQPARTSRRPTAAESKNAFLANCGKCHPPERVTATRRTKAQWEESINAMVTARGAVVTAEDYDLVLDYLVREFSPLPPRTGIAVTGPGRSASSAQPPRPAPGATTPPPATPGPAPAPPRMSGGAGPNDKHIVDATAAARGRSTYAASCIACHGTQARGGERGANLVRSLVLLRDRYGSEVGPFLRKGHPAPGGASGTASSPSFTDAQLKDLSHFLHERLNDTLRGSPIFTVKNVLTGNRQAGEAWFNGDGGCRQCHSATGDLAGIGSRFDPPTLQQRFLFPRPPGRGQRGASATASGKPVTVRVTTPAGQTAEGVLVYMDDFNVSLRDASGQQRTWTRTPGLAVVRNDPYAAHIALLDKYTDANMHDIVAYLESLK
jgi:cytochrome c oxidase cbb3-type subunit 3